MPFNYVNNQLHAEGVSVAEVAATVGTPFYLYSSLALETQYARLAAALTPLPHQICFAVKALSNVAVLAQLARLGAGMDVVSSGEYLRAKAAGVPGDRIVFSGVGKTRLEMRQAIEGGIRQFNLESEPEMHALSEVAASMGVTVPVAVRLNPDVDARTHHKIATGRKDNKFGIPIARAFDVYAQIADLPGLRAVGIDVHIGSQLTDLAPFEAAFAMMGQLVPQLRAQGHPISRIDLGGGLGISYQDSGPQPPQPEDYGALIRRCLGHLDCEIDIEPGRLIAGNAGLLISSVLYVKQGDGRDFLILDAAMNDLLRPSMYEAYHDILPVVVPPMGEPFRSFDVVGPVCETGDTFAMARTLPALRQADLVAFRSVGAYGAVMASEYNTRPLIPEVLVRGREYSVIRKRPDLAEILARDILPPWLSEARS